MSATDYGYDLTTYAQGIQGGAGGLDPAFRVISGPRVVVEAIVRRWTTPRGSLITDPNAGIDLRAFIGQGVTQNNVRLIAPFLVREAMADERVLDAQVVPTYDFASRTMTIGATITLAQGPFSFVVSASAERIIILSGPA